MRQKAQPRCPDISRLREEEVIEKCEAAREGKLHHPLELQDKQLATLKLRMAAIPLIIIRLDLAVLPLVVSTIMKGNTFSFSFQLNYLVSQSDRL